MSGKPYDAIVVGARCAGSPTAMILARKGYRVLLVDRATFPSDTVSTLCIQPTGVQKLREWGLLDQVTATGCPPIDTMLFDFGPVVISGTPGLPDSPVAYAPRRTVLDKLLVDAAAEAGAEIREGFNVEDVVVEDGTVVGIRGHAIGGASVTEHARIVIGADGLNSSVAKSVQPETYAEKPKLLCGYYAYWSGLPTNGTFETYIRPNRGFAVIPTNDDLTLVIGGWPYAEFAANKADLQGNYLRTLALAPDTRRSARRRHPGEPDRRIRRAQLLPQALRPGLGAGRRRRLQPGLHHRTRDLRRVPRRRPVRNRGRRLVVRRTRAGRRDERLSADPRRPGHADV